jgi:hypothetical protein
MAEEVNLEDEVNELDDFTPNIPEPDLEAEPERTPDAVSKPAEIEEDDAESEPEPEPESEPVAAESAPEPEPVEKESEGDIIAQLRAEIANRDSTILALKSGQPAPEPALPKEESQTPPAKAMPTPQPAPVSSDEPVDYIGDLDIDDVTADKEIFNRIINQAVADAVARAKTAATQDTMLAIPDVIQHQVKQQNYINNAVRSFYEDNPDLSEVRPTVAAVAQNLAAEHPDWNIEKLFTEAGEATRKVLRLPKAASSTKPDDNSEFTNPAFTGKTSKRSAPRQVSDLQKEIDEL